MTQCTLAYTIHSYYCKGIKFQPQNQNFTPMSLHSVEINLWYFKLIQLDQSEFIVLNSKGILKRKGQKNRVFRRKKLNSKNWTIHTCFCYLKIIQNAHMTFNVNKSSCDKSIFFNLLNFVPSLRFINDRSFAFVNILEQWHR